MSPLSSVGCRLGAGSLEDRTRTIIVSAAICMSEPPAASPSETAPADPARAADPELLATLAYLLRLAPVFSLRGGTREILRGMIARGLGLR